MDDIAIYNIHRWEQLVKANALFTRPKLELTAESAREWVNPHNRYGDLSGKQVLLLGGGGGQQSGAFALLGAKVTVFDIAEGQLVRDQQVAQHYGVAIKTVQGDMRDLSALEGHSFDIITQPYSLNFVPDAHVVFQQVERVIRSGGIYTFMVANPFVMGLNSNSWTGEGYLLKSPHINGAPIRYPDQNWVYERDEDMIPSPQEYRQILSHIINGLIAHDFMITHLSDSDSMYPDLNAEAGSWDHQVAYAPPWFTLWTRHTPLTD